MNRQLILTAVLAALLLPSGCAKPNRDDPLKNTKKLVTKGHADLYENGAFQVGHTSLKLIPAGPEPLDLAKELVGIRATDSFSKAIKEAKESVYLIPEGTRFSYELSKKIYGASADTSDAITDATRLSGVWMIERSSDYAKELVTGSVQSAQDTGLWLYGEGDRIENAMHDDSSATLRQDKADAAKTFDRTLKLGGDISGDTAEGAGETMHFAAVHFVQGYTTLPDKLADRGERIAEAANGDNFVEHYDASEAFRAEHSLYFSDLVSDAVNGYGERVSVSMEKAHDAFVDNYEDEGVIFASLKSMRWALQAVLYDGLIEPLGKITAGSVGYLSVNGVVFPVMVVVREGVAVTEVAVAVTWHSGAALYEITAPTVVSAVAGVIGSAEYLGGKVAAAGVVAAGSTVSAVQAGAGYVKAGAGHTAAFVSGKSIKYIGVPIAATGVAVSQASYGVVAGTSGVVAGSTVVVGGEAAGLTTQAFGTVLSGTVLVGGTTASVAAGAGIGAYQLSKAVVVPSGYALGSGVVLGYGTTSQLAAHSVLAVSDAAYLVLSLEGPRWVVYAVSGNLGGSEALPAGAVVDLKAMQASGEEIRYLPVSEGEMAGVVTNLPEDLPQEQ